MAFTVVAALVGAMILSLTFIPAAIALFIGKNVAEKENRVMEFAKRLYTPLLAKALLNKAIVVTSAVVLIVLSGAVASRMGSEFIPNLNEGDFAIQSLRIPGTSLTQSIEMQKQLEAGLKAKFPEN